MSDSLDYMERLQNAVRKLERKVQKLEDLRKEARASKFDAQRALSYATACAEMSKYWADEAIGHIEGALNGD